MLAGEGLGGVMQALLAVAKVDGSRESYCFSVVLCLSDLLLLQASAPRSAALALSSAGDLNISLLGIISSERCHDLRCCKNIM